VEVMAMCTGKVFFRFCVFSCCVFPSCLSQHQLVGAPRIFLSWYHAYTQTNKNSWNLLSRKCVNRFSNEDGTIISSLSASFQHLAVGAESGVVNLYSHCSTKPMKSIMNLSTSADTVKFNHDGQVLCMTSKREKHSLKVLHVPTATVFSNWPTSKTPLNYVWSVDFSPQSKFLAIGNDKGKCLLYKLQHYHTND
jgi:U3 small nucleolar RNA-associated protein 18